MLNSLSELNFFRMRKQILDSVLKTPYTPQETSRISTKSILESLLSTKLLSLNDFALACALLSASRSSTHVLLKWIPGHLSTAAETAFSDLSTAAETVFSDFSKVVNVAVSKVNLAAVIMPEIFPVLKEKIKESSIYKSDENDEFSAASGRVPVGFAILAAYQIRWFVSQIGYPDLSSVINLIIPCALTCLDHWSPEVKGQGMISIIHVAKNMKGAELDSYGNVILDACFKNFDSPDEIWEYAVEMSVLIGTCIQRDNPSFPRTFWLHYMLNEMLSHLERQPSNKERHVAWLKYIDPLLNSLGLFILVHIRRIFILFFLWMRVDDDETVLLVLKRLETVVRITWIRYSPYDESLVNALVIIFKKAAVRKAREKIETAIRNLLIMIQQCKGLQFERNWNKHQNDPNLITLAHALSVSRDYYLQPDHPEKVFKPLRIDGPKLKRGSELKIEAIKPKPKTIKIDDQTEPKW